MIDQDKFAKFVAELRKEKGLTQEELAGRLYVGREAVSKWERGIGLPSHTVLLLLSNEFGVSINELLYGERKTESNEEEIEQAAYKWLDIISKKLTNWKKLFVITLIGIIIIYIISYFIFNYNSFKIYATYTSNENFTINPGLIVRYHNHLYFKFGSVINHDENEIIGMTLYYGEETYDKRTKLISGNPLEDSMLDIKELEKNTEKDLKDILDNLYIVVSTPTIEEECKLNIDLDFKSNLLSKEDSKNNEDASGSDIETYSDDSNEESIKNKFKLKDGKYIYEFKYKNKKYKCTLKEDSIHFIYNDISFRYRIGTNKIYIDDGTNTSVYNINTKKCDTDECEKYTKIINIFIKNVLN